MIVLTGEEGEQVEKENKVIEEEEDQVPPEVVASDFVARKDGPLGERRKFLLNYCKTEEDST